MEQKITEEFLVELLCSKDPDEFIDNTDFEDKSLSEYLQDILKAKNLKRADVIRAADINETHGYQIFTGSRGASRDTVLKLAFALQLTLFETGRLLRSAGVNSLYCKNRRDAIIIFCITHGYSLQKTNEELYRFKEETFS